MTSTLEPLCTQLGPGSVQIQFNDLKQFIDYLYGDLLEFGSYVWRGHRCDHWKLEPTLDRLVREAKIEHVKSWQFKGEHLEAFKRATRGKRNSYLPAPTDENEWWALGQHHGLATPLLDWTTSPFVAAFFAFATTGADQTAHRAIYALHQPSVKKMAEQARLAEDELREKEREELKVTGKTPGLMRGFFLGLKAEEEVVFVRPRSDEHHRLVAQGGLFTRSTTSIPIEQWILDQPLSGTEIVLLKCLVPDNERARCLQLLNRMSINPSSLFPDLSGASQYCNLHSEIENY
jgi:hypothetical protein